MDTKNIDKLFNTLTASRKIHECILLIENTTGDLTFKREYKRDVNTPMLMASITKLFTTTCILALMQEGKLNLYDKISSYLNKEIISGLHIYKGNDYSSELTLEHLLFQTSGLPDYYLEGSNSVFSKVKEYDFSISFEDELKWVKSMKANFVPGAKRRAYYADINFDLLGKIIEKINESTLQEAYAKYIFTPLNLKSTYLASSTNDFVPHTYFKQNRLKRPMLVRSCYASGGGVTTSKELMIFIKAFFNGRLFDKDILTKLTQSNPLQLSFYPIRYISGYMQITAAYPFGKKKTLVGHSGSTGSFAFYCPEDDLFFVGDIPQMASPSTCIRLVMRAALS